MPSLPAVIANLFVIKISDVACLTGKMMLKVEKLEADFQMNDDPESLMEP
jgi:hypothetical protein